MRRDTVALAVFLALGLVPGLVFADVSPAAVGWGNLFVPGLGATLRGEPTRGLVEAGAEIGLFYGGTFGAREGAFSIDSTVVPSRDPNTGSLALPLVGQALQQVGLKLHMYDTFYHYQQACLSIQDSDREKSNPQPLYKGTWWDVLSAPFRWENLSNPWVYTGILASAALIFYEYKTQSNAPQASATTWENSLYATNYMAVIPLGSAFGEEPLFRGFMEREARLYTGSLLAAIALETTVFSALHPSSQVLPAIAGGLYFGFLVDHEHGDLGPSTTIHFWADAISGILDFFAFRAAQGAWAPFNPPVGLKITMPL